MIYIAFAKNKQLCNKHNCIYGHCEVLLLLHIIGHCIFSCRLHPRLQARSEIIYVMVCARHIKHWVLCQYA